MKMEEVKDGKTVTKTVCINKEQLQTWNKLNKKSRLVQIIISISETYDNPNDVLDELTTLLMNRRTVLREKSI